MKSISQHLIVALAVLASSGCEVSSLQSSVSSRRDGGQSVVGSDEGGSSEQPASTVQTENGAMLSKDSTDAMKMSGTTSDVIIMPGSLTVDSQVSVEDYKRSDPNYIAHELGLENGEVEAVGVTQVKSSSTESLAKPMTITLEIGTNLLEFFLSEPYYFVVCTARKDGQDPKVWTIASEDIVVAGQTLQFQTKEFGVFEVFKAYRPVHNVKEMADSAMNAFTEPLAVSGLSTAVLGTGRTVTIEGLHLGEDTRVLIGDHPAPIRAFAPHQVSFTVPEFSEFGPSTIKIMNRYNTISKEVIYKGSKTDLPLIAQLPAEVCKGTAYYNMRGLKRIGTKVCALSDARTCTAAIKEDCIADATMSAIDPSTVPPGDLAQGYSLAGVAGTLNLLDSISSCDHDGQVDCRANTAFKAVEKSSLQAAAIPQGVSFAGVAGAFPAPRPTCSQAETSGCDIPPASVSHVAVKDTDLDPTIIRNGVTIGGQTGTYPSSGNPLLGSITVSLTAGSFPHRLASSAPFEFFDRFGNFNLKQGDSDLVAENIAAGATIWGVSGSYRVDSPNAEGSDADYRWGHAYKDMTSGKIKTNCRSLVLPTSSNLPENNVAGHLWDEPTENPWGDEGFACLSEGWTVFDSNCDGKTAESCLVQDKKTLAMWTTAGLQTGSAVAAQSHCEGLTLQGYNDWRVPTQKEAMQAFINGMSSLTPSLFRLDPGGYRLYWTSTIPRTQVGASNPPYWNIDMTSGMASTSIDKPVHVLCVRNL